MPPIDLSTRGSCRSMMECDGRDRIRFEIHRRVLIRNLRAVCGRTHVLVEVDRCAFRRRDLRNYARIHVRWGRDNQIPCGVGILR